MSLKHLAKSTVLNQTTDFKVNLLAADKLSIGESIKIVVDEIWDSFDIDGSGQLSKDEVKEFVLEYMPDFKKDFTFSEAEFDELFRQFDTDGSGEVDKQEMADFIFKLVSGDEPGKTLPSIDEGVGVDMRELNVALVEKNPEMETRTARTNTELLPPSVNTIQAPENNK